MNSQKDVGNAVTPPQGRDEAPERTPRHPAGRGSQVRPDERRAIQLARLAEGLTHQQLAQRFGRTRETIASMLRGEDYERLKGEVEATMLEEARATLKAFVRPSAKAWTRAVQKAADKGDHRPAKDLLMHTGVIEPLRDEGAHGPLVLVGLNMHQYRDPMTGQIYDRLPEGQTTIVVGMPGGPIPVADPGTKRRSGNG